MRIQLTLELIQKPQILPLNYKYPVSSWIYKIFFAADTEFARQLHQLGYQTPEGKRLKFFTFSDFAVPKGTWKIMGDRMKIWADAVTLTLAFHFPEQLQHFISGLFINQVLWIGDAISQIQFRVKQVELIAATFDEKDSYTLRWLSPIFLEQTIEGFKYGQYIEPVKPSYATLFTQNLIDKYQAYCLLQNTAPLPYTTSDIEFTCLTPNPVSVKQTIKAFSKEQTEIRAFKFNFELKAPKQLVELGLNAGFGSGNAQGFGCCELVNK